MRRACLLRRGAGRTEAASHQVHGAAACHVQLTEAAGSHDALRSWGSTPESCGAGWQGVQAARSHVEHYLASLQTRSLAASQGGGDAPGVRRGCRSASVCSDPSANPGLCFRPCHLPAWSRAVSCMICQRDSCGNTPSSRMSDISPQRRHPASTAQMSVPLLEVRWPAVLEAPHLHLCLHRHIRAT